jgi:lysine 2,3-aminomutase
VEPFEGEVICPIAKTVIPSAKEFAVDDLETLDPLAEDEFRPVPAIVHRYKNRCLFMVTGRCATYCRYCTRSRLVGDPSKLSTQKRNWDQGIEYIKNQKHISDVVLSGGDPMTLNNDDLEYIVSSLRSIPHVEIIRMYLTKLKPILVATSQNGLPPNLPSMSP